MASVDAMNVVRVVVGAQSSSILNADLLQDRVVANGIPVSVQVQVRNGFNGHLSVCLDRAQKGENKEKDHKLIHFKYFKSSGKEDKESES